MKHSPSGFTPDCAPSGGASCAIWAAEAVPLSPALLLAGAAAAAEVVAGAAAAAEVVAGAAADVLAGAGEAVTPGRTTVDGSWPALTAACWAEKVVAATGQPTPGPLMFCRVTAAALIRASWDAWELSVGKDSFTVGLLMTNPALTFWFSS